MSGGIEVVCFDLGGVLLRICRSWEEACLRAGLPLRDGPVLRSPELVEARRAIKDDYETGGMACEDYVRAIAGATAGLYSAAEVRRIHDAWIIEDYPGARELVERLNRHAGITTACLSNTNRMHWRAGLGEEGGAPVSPAVTRVRRRFASHEVGLAKPDPRFYAHADGELGVAPARVLFFDDLGENTAAARARGWRAEQIDHTGDTAAQMRAHLASHGIIV